MFMIAGLYIYNVLDSERDVKREKIMCFFIHITILTNVNKFVKLCNEIVDYLYPKLSVMFSLDLS